MAGSAAGARAGRGGSGSASSPFSRKSVLTPNSSLSASTLSSSGWLAPLSHLDTDWRETFRCSASSSCDQPDRLRRSAILSDNI